MQNTGQGSDKKSPRVILLLIVGLAALSSAMNQLDQAQALTLQTTNLVAQWTGAFAPADGSMIVRVETCQKRKMLLPSAPEVPDLPPLPTAPVQVNIPEVVMPEALPAPPTPPAPAVRAVPKSKRIVISAS